MARNYYQDLLTAQQRREGILENSGRMAWLNIEFETEGTGELLPSVPLEFPTPFFAKPSISHGFELIRRPDLPHPPAKPWEDFAERVESDANYSLADAQSDYARQYVYTLPQVTAGVYRWVKNSRGFYLGAYCYYSISVEFTDSDYIPRPDSPVAHPIIHHVFTFGGPSYKSMSDEVNERAADRAILPLTPPAV